MLVVGGLLLERSAKHIGTQYIMFIKRVQSFLKVTCNTVSLQSVSFFFVLRNYFKAGLH